MCVTLGKAKLSDTIIYADERIVDGRKVHVLAYQNKVENYERGANAMILPIPSVKMLTAENAIDLSQCKDVLKVYRQVVATEHHTYKSSMLLNSRSVGPAVSVFTSGSYQVVVAENPMDLPKVVEEVAPDTHINPVLMERYATFYEGWPVAVCIFTKRIEAEPIMFWYEPMYPNYLFVPTLDAHDGQAPRPMSALDHTIVFGADRYGKFVRWKDPPTAEASNYLSDRVVGFYANHFTSNGDYWLHTSYAKSLESLHISGATLRLPPGVSPQ